MMQLDCNRSAVRLDNVAISSDLCGPLFGHSTLETTAGVYSSQLTIHTRLSERGLLPLHSYYVNATSNQLKKLLFHTLYK